VNRAGSGLVRGSIGIGISIAALFLAVRQVDLARTADVLRAAAPAWLVVMLACQVLDVGIRARRWQRLVEPIARVGYRPMLGYTLIGYGANNVLPARLGEFVRSHYLGDRERVSRTTTLGTVVVERVVDTGVLVAIASLAIFVLHVRGVVANAILLGLGVAGLLVVGLAVGIFAHRLPGADRVAALVRRWPRIGQLAVRLQGGLAVASRPWTLGEAVLLSVLAWGTTIVAFAAAGQSIGVELTTAGATLLASGVALSTAIPAGPGYVGTFELAAVEVGAALGLGHDQAFALALLVHGSVLVLTSLGGAVAFVRLGWRPSDIEERPGAGKPAGAGEKSAASENAGAR
jgi:hypothetical protein